MHILKTKLYIPLLILFFFNIKLGYTQGASEIDSLKQLLSTTKEKDKAKILNKLCWKLRNLQPKESIKFGSQSILLAIENKETVELAKAYGFTGVAYRNLGFYTEAFDKYFKGLEISRKYKLHEQEGYALINIGNLYIYQEDYDAAIEYLSKAVTIAEKINNKKMTAYCKLNLGRAMLLKKEYKKSLDFFLSTLKIRTEMSDEEGQAVCYKYIADAYLGQGKFEEAIKNYNISLKTVEQLTDRDLVSDIYTQLAKTTLLTNNLKQAQKYAETSLSEAKFINSKLRIRNSYKILSEINFTLNDYRKSTEYLQLYIAYNDSIFNQKLNQKISNLKFNSQQEKKQSKINLLNKEKRINDLELTKEKERKRLLLTGLIGLGILVVVGVFLSIKLRIKNKFLSDNKSIIDKQKQELTKSLKTQNEINQKFFAKNLMLDEQKSELKEYSEKLVQQNEKINAINNELNEKQEQIANQNNELEQTLEIVTTQQKKILKANLNITHSINYARTIQEALLTRKETFDSLFNDYFILFKPKEVVSGDFYYANKVGNYTIFAAADCTGHGVPGGFLTMLGITYLHGIIRRKEAQTTGKTLEVLRQRFKDIFLQFGSRNMNGLDIALCAINTETNIIEYSGAYNPLIIIRDNELIECKATRNPIGFYPKEKPFATNKIQLQDNDVIYIYSDGFQDQIGGKNLRKFSSKRFKELLLQIYTLTMPEQNKILENTLKKWRGKFDQVDDITVIGIRYSTDKQDKE